MQLQAINTAAGTNFYALGEHAYHAGSALTDNPLKGHRARCWSIGWMRQEIAARPI